MPTLVFYVDSYSSKLSLESSFGVSGVRISEHYRLRVTYDASDESISANGKKWKTLYPVSELTPERRRTWDHFLMNKPTYVIYYCNTSFDIAIWGADDVNSPGSIAFKLETPSSTIEILARFVSILDAQE